MLSTGSRAEGRTIVSEPGEGKCKEMNVITGSNMTVSTDKVNPVESKKCITSLSINVSPNFYDKKSPE
uniref:AlNc14C91G5691 protein n=1 Tax=Albugo laibachii Nc14 TaxID=890382 RepID=F0WGF9_9STRA|nr:AlNc14C91G5691 [Albugo laibachii Nc14]|eukprot:CCA20321.1 AlNc14C91G5691 [Albugo laibachii Nc14]